MVPWQRLLPVVLALAWALPQAACTSTGKVSETKSLEHVDSVAKLVDADVEEVRRGLPRGAKALGELWRSDGAKDSGAKDDALGDPSRLRHALDKAREDDRDLEVAKSTFFAITDDKGVIARSDLDPDVMVGKGVTVAYPALVRALSGETVETLGSMPEASGARSGADEQWVAAAPVRDDKGAVRGLYMTGWSLRRFAYHLEEALRHDWVAAALKENNTQVKQPLLYVFVFDSAHAYGAPITPMVDVQALEGLDLAGKTAGDVVFHQQIEITGRTYGVAARRTPKLGPNAGIAVLRSEI